MHSSLSASNRTVSTLASSSKNKAANGVALPACHLLSCSGRVMNMTRNSSLMAIFSRTNAYCTGGDDADAPADSVMEEAPTGVASEGTWKKEQ